MSTVVRQPMYGWDTISWKQGERVVFKLQKHGSYAFALEETWARPTGVPPRPEGCIDHRVARLHVEQAPNLFGEDGDVISRVWLQDARQHAPHSLRPR